MTMYRRAFAALATATLISTAGLVGAAQGQSAPPVGAAFVSDPPPGIAPEQSAGFARGRYHELDQLPDWGGIWFLQRGDPAMGRIAQPPLQGQYLEDWNRWREQVQANDGVELRSRSNCSPPGLPRIMMLAQYPYEFLFTPGRVTINQEAWMQTRTIWTDGREHPPLEEITPSFHGHSVGHWEGDTLVIRTTGIKESVEFQWTPHSEAMVITERIRLLSPDMLHNEITVEDEYFERPWTYSYSYRRMPGYRLQEYVCEDNRDYVDENGNHTMRLPGEE